MASVASQLIEEVSARAQSDSLEDAREICSDGIYFPNNLRIWPDDGFFEPKHVAEFLISITIYTVVLLTGTHYYNIAIHNRMAPTKIENCG